MLSGTQVNNLLISSGFLSDSNRTTGICGPDLDLIHLEFPLDGGILALQAGQPRLDVLIGSDQGEVGSRVDIVRGQRGGVPCHAAAAILFQAPCVAAAASQQPQLPSSEQRLHHSEPQPEDRRTQNQLLTHEKQSRRISVWGQPSASNKRRTKSVRGTDKVKYSKALRTAGDFGSLMWSRSDRGDSGYPGEFRLAGLRVANTEADEHETVKLY